MMAVKVGRIDCGSAILRAFLNQKANLDIIFSGLFVNLGHKGTIKFTSVQIFQLKVSSLKARKLFRERRKAPTV